MSGGLVVYTRDESQFRWALAETDPMEYHFER